MPQGMEWLGRMLIGLGVFLVVLGLLMWGLARLPGLGFLGRLPGDLHWKKDGIEIYVPLMTSLLLSLLLTLLLNLFLFVWMRRG